MHVLTVYRYVRRQEVAIWEARDAQFFRGNLEMPIRVSALPVFQKHEGKGPHLCVRAEEPHLISYFEHENTARIGSFESQDLDI